MLTETGLIVAAGGLPLALQNAIALWAEASTDPTSGRRVDLVRDKTRMVGGFFTWSQLHPAQVRELDVAAWRAELEGRGLSPSSVYGYISRLSAWYDWAMRDAATREHVKRNPVQAARPKAPKAYQSERTAALSDNELLRLLAVVKARAAGGDVIGLRDYALLLAFSLSGFRRNEVISWTGGKVKLNGRMTVTVRVKGGELRTRELNPQIMAATRAYLLASGRDPANLAPAEPIWLAHDRGLGKRAAGRQLTSHALAKAMKRYAEAAGIAGFHLHALRHTYLSMVYEATGDEAAAQHEAGHKNASTTRVYLHRVAVRRDRYSGLVASKLGLGA